MIEVRPTLLPRYRAHARFDLDLTFNPRRAMFMTQKYTTTQVQRSVGSKDGVERNRQTDATHCFSIAANVVGDYFEHLNFITLTNCVGPQCI